MKLKDCFLKRFFFLKIDKPLARLIKKKGDRAQVNELEMEQEKLE